MMAKASSFSRAARTQQLITASYGAGRTVIARPVTQKRIGRLRLNWFLVGSVCGIGLSFFMNALFTGVIMPQYRSFMAAQHPRMASIYDNMPEAVRATAQSVLPVPKTKNSEPVQQAQVVELVPEPQFPRKLALKVSSGDTLLQMLMDQNVPSSEAHDVVNLLRKEFNPRALRVGQKISLTLARHEQLDNMAAVQELAIRLPSLTTVELARLNDGNFALEAQHAKLHNAPYRAVGKVRSSLYQAAADAGIPSGVMAELVRAFSYDVDFQREIHPGDSIEVLMDRKVAETGEVGGHSNVRYAALSLRGKKHEIFHYADASGAQGWFDAKGNSVKKSLLKTPVNAARISSGFGLRRHPVLGYSKMHRGVDFAARTGTPILAAGDGIVTFRGWKGGYGNYVQIKHNNTYSTAYGHISRFNSAVKNGSRVKQGQVIAYVGSTGMSTGPHLHFEVLQAGRQVNPTAQKFNTSQALAGASLNKFKARQSAIRAEVASLEPNGKPKLAGTQVAQATTAAQ